jgi:hypothetical protein
MRSRTPAISSFVITKTVNRDQVAVDAAVANSLRNQTAGVVGET